MGDGPDAKVPKVGTWWVWELHDPKARSLVQVSAVRWNGEEWWVRLWPNGHIGPLDPRGYWNELSRFREACDPVLPEGCYVWTRYGAEYGKDRTWGDGKDRMERRTDA